MEMGRFMRNASWVLRSSTTMRFAASALTNALITSSGQMTGTIAPSLKTPSSRRSERDDVSSWKHQLIDIEASTTQLNGDGLA